MLAGYQDSSGDERQESGQEGDGGAGSQDLKTSLDERLLESDQH